ncbi:MAG: hypothetical protein COS85_01935 [Armatimonadetes bacterium CG07_land_8_20_14_0_80_59_28]|nr:MAG: hypothetical protein COS85_01935 [Armatimonadetes bacterium CG07_land_8_20_14_0_80_59_28]PIY48406.1 MAG: hypothetical protein COZ05_03205 [Armatimonadetes bacterium CG_4_10_14_3_um_filter_59_10]
MAHTLTIRLREELYELLEQMGERAGKTSDELGSQWIELALERVVNDPLFKHAGSVNSGVTDWADRHDYYLGQTLKEEMDGADTCKT